MNNKIATFALVVLAFAAGWIGRHVTFDRYQIITTGQHPIIKLDTRTGKAWRYFMNQSTTEGKPSLEGFTRLEDF